MGTQTLEELTNVTFPRAITVKELDAFFQHLDQKLNCSTSYVQTKHKHIGQSEVPQKPKVTSIEIKGGLNEKQAPYAGASFHTYFDKISSAKRFKGLKFETIVGYELHEHRKEEVALWERVQNAAKDYFSNLKS